MDELKAAAEETRTRPASCGAITFSPEGKLLLIHRENVPGIPHPNLWAILGGAMEAGEEPLQTLGREIAEEANISLLPGQATLLGRLEAGDDRDHDKNIALVRLTPEQAAAIKKGREGQELKFFSPGELKNIPLVPDIVTLLASHMDTLKKIAAGMQPDKKDLDLV